MNAYYLIPVERLEEAQQYATKDGLPCQKFHYALTEDGKFAIVQAEWTDEAGIAALGEKLGEFANKQPSTDIAAAVATEVPVLQAKVAKVKLEA